MTKKSNGFGQAALAAYKKRQARTGDMKCFHAGSPILEAAKDDPECALMDLDWLERTLESIPGEKLSCLNELLRVLEDHPRGKTAAFKTMTLYQLLKGAEARGHLAQFQKPVTGPVPPRMTEAQLRRVRAYLKQHVVPDDFKPWDFTDEQHS